MSRSDEPTNDEPASSNEPATSDPARSDPVGVRATDWLAASTLRVALTVLGFVLLLFAIGQAVGLDLLGMVVDALNTGIGRWIVVAFVGLLLIAFALRGFDDDRE